jgi:hypothetical protein
MPPKAFRLFSILVTRYEHAVQYSYPLHTMYIKTVLFSEAEKRGGSYTRGHEAEKSGGPDTRGHEGEKRGGPTSRGCL